MVHMSQRQADFAQDRPNGVESLGNWALVRMRADILTLKLAPGEVVSERFLETSYGVSRTPIREALAELIRQGLVVRSERGYAVAPFDLPRLEEIFEYRELVEDAAIRLACERAKPEEIDATQQTIDRGLTDFTPNGWFDVGLDFHVQLAALSKNRFLRDSVQDSVTRTLRARWLVASSAEMRAIAYGEHSEIIEMVRQRQSDNAAAAIRRHAREVRLQILRALEDTRRLFSQRGFVGEAWREEDFRR